MAERRRAQADGASTDESECVNAPTTGLRCTGGWEESPDDAAPGKGSSDALHRERNQSNANSAALVNAGAADFFDFLIDLFLAA